MYQYYIQQIVNKYNNSVIGYELLLRQRVENGWGPVTNFADVPAEIIAKKIVTIAHQLYTKVPFLSVNVNRTQLMNQEVVKALIKIQKSLRPVQIQVELTEDDPETTISEKHVMAQLQYFKAHGMTVSIDDVDCGCNTQDQVNLLLPFVNEIKFALQNFGQSVYLPEIKQRMLFWRDFAKQHQIRFILEGIENEAIDHFIDHFDIDIRQGYFYEKPHAIAARPGWQNLKDS